MSISLWCTRIIRSAYYALVVVVPLIILPWNYELFEFNKMMVTYAITTVIVCAWIAKWFAEGKVTIAKTPLDIPIALFFFSQLVSSLFSIDPHISWFGYYSRFNGGMWSTVSYIILYYAFVTNFLSPELHLEINGQKARSKYDDPTFYGNNAFVLSFLYTALTTAFLIALYGVAERFGIDKHLWVQDVQNRVFSTLGQPNWLAAYLVALLPISMWLAIRSILQKPAHTTSSWDMLATPGFLVWSLVSAVYFWTLLLTRSRSGYIGFAVADVLFVSILWLQIHVYKTKTAIVPATIIINSIFAIIVFFNGTKIDRIDAWLTLNGLQQKFAGTVQQNTTTPNERTKPPTGETKLLDVGISESTDIRKHVWRAAADAWLSGPKTFLVGTGTETFAFAFYQFRPKEHNMTSEWDFLYNKAHNEYLNYLATTGMLGLGSYSVFLIIVILWILRHIVNTKNRINHESSGGLQSYSMQSVVLDQKILIVALFAGWASILVTNYFGFSVVIVQIFLFLFPAMILLLTKIILQGSFQILTVHLPNKKGFKAIGPTIMLVLFVLQLVNLSLGWWADSLFALGYRENRSEDYTVSEPNLSLAVVLRPGEPFYRDELATALAGLAIAAIGENNTEKAADLAKRAFVQSDKALTQSPKNVNFWKTRTKLYYTLAEYDANLLPPAISALEQARTLSPNDVKIMYNLAILYGRAGQADKAIAILKDGITIKPDYRDLYYGLYVFYDETNDTKSARAVVTEYLTRVDPGDLHFKELQASFH